MKFHKLFHANFSDISSLHWGAVGKLSGNSFVGFSPPSFAMRAQLKRLHRAVDIVDWG